jgi:dTDP-glucose 4,6-dehydratase
MSDLGEFTRRIAITGGAGFIGSNLLLFMTPRYSKYLFVNIDLLTYAGNLSNLKPIEECPNYHFEHIDIRDFDSLKRCFDKYDIDAVINLAAESHVDRSIIGPSEFITTNILGTFNLLELARERIISGKKFRFHQVSTDEVFGSLGEAGYFQEATPYSPNSPYSASKASADHLVRAYHHTYGLDVVTTNCSNNYGPYQFPEKLIPLVIRNAIAGMPIPVYGDGKNIRDWLYVEDHCRALDLVFHKGKSGQTYNIGGHNEIENIELVRQICHHIDQQLGGENHEKLITFVKDRPGHDRRYAIDSSFIEAALGWKPEYQFDAGLEKTVAWYLNNKKWLDDCISGKYLQYYNKQYVKR